MKKQQISSSVRVSDAQSSRGNLWAQGTAAVMAALLGLALVPNLVHADPRRTEVDPPSGGTPIVLDIENGTVREGNAGVTMLKFRVRVEPVSSKAISVAWRLSDGSASCADKDYEAASGVLTLPANASSGEILVAVNGDQTFESDEIFTLELSDAVNAQLVSESATGTILNDDRRGGGGGPRRLPEGGAIGMEGRRPLDAPAAKQIDAPAEKKATTWGALKVHYR